MREESQRWERPSTDADERRALRRARRLCKEPEALPLNTTEPDNVGGQSVDLKPSKDFSHSDPPLSAEGSVATSRVQVIIILQ